MPKKMDQTELISKKFNTPEEARAYLVEHGVDTKNLHIHDIRHWKTKTWIKALFWLGDDEPLTVASMDTVRKREVSFYSLQTHAVKVLKEKGFL